MSEQELEVYTGEAGSQRDMTDRPASTAAQRSPHQGLSPMPARSDLRSINSAGV